MADIFKTDLRIVFQGTGHGPVVELATGARGPAAVSGIDNLVQALTLRLLVDQGELAGLGHPRYGSRIRELLGARLDRANLELIRRFVRQTLLSPDAARRPARRRSRSHRRPAARRCAGYRRCRSGSPVHQRRSRADRSQLRCRLRRLSTARTSPR